MKLKIDVVTLIKTIKGEMYRFETWRYKPDALNAAAANFYNCMQTMETGDCDIAPYMERMLAYTEVCTHYGGTVCNYPGLVDDTITQLYPKMMAALATDKQQAKAERVSR